MPYRRRCTFGPVVSAGALGVIAASMLAAGGLSLGPTRIVAAARVSSALSTGTLPLTRVIGINLGGGQAGPETPLSAVPAEFSDLATNLHVTWVRYDFSWWNVCPPAQACNWTTADTIMQDAAQTGLGIVAILGSPYWPSSTPVLPTASQWTAYVTAFTQRYDAVWKPEGLRGLVIEPWNEPENNWFSGAAAWATQIQLPAYQAVKAVDPSVLVAMATTDWASGGQSWWQQVASALSGQPFVDLPGYHDYANSTDSWNPSFRAFLASHGVAYKAVWATEFGAGMTPPAPFDDTAHINVLQSQIPPVLNGASVDGLFYYAYKDLAEGGAVQESYGLMDEYGNHYQSYSVFQQLTGGCGSPPPGGGGSSPSGGGYTLDGFGGVHPFGDSAPVTITGCWPNWDIARALTLDACDSPGQVSGWVLDGFGGLHPFAAAGTPMPAIPDVTGYWPGWDIANDVASFCISVNGVLHAGGCVLDGFGGLHPWADSSAVIGDVPCTGTGYWPNWDIATKITVIPGTDQGYVMDGFGGLHPFNGAPYYAATGYWPGWTIARGVVATASGGYTVDGFGGIHPFGTAPIITPTGYWPNWDIVRGIAVAYGGTGTYTLDGFGGVHPAGGAPSLSVSGYWPNWDIAIDLVTAP